MAIEITDSNFEELVLKAEKPVVIDFWAVWCGPCRMVGKIIDEIGEEFKDKVVIGKVNVDENSAITAKFGIRNIPTIIFFKNGEAVDKQVGAVPKQALVNKIEALL
jgi:thioredoxin 1